MKCSNTIRGVQIVISSAGNLRGGILDEARNRIPAESCFLRLEVVVLFG